MTTKKKKKIFLKNRWIVIKRNHTVYLYKLYIMHISINTNERHRIRMQTNSNDDNIVNAHLFFFFTRGLLTTYLY